MKPSLQFSVPCLSIPEGPLPTFENVFYELPSPQFPMKVSFFLANGWCSGQGDFEQEVRVLTPAGQALVQTGPQRFNLPHERQPYMVVNNFQNLVFDAPGVYRIQVTLDGMPVLDYPMEIRQYFETPETDPEKSAAAQASPAPQQSSGGQPIFQADSSFQTPSGLG